MLPSVTSCAIGQVARERRTALWPANVDIHKKNIQHDFGGSVSMFAFVPDAGVVSSSSNLPSATKKSKLRVMFQCFMFQTTTTFVRLCIVKRAWFNPTCLKKASSLFPQLSCHGFAMPWACMFINVIILSTLGCNIQRTRWRAHHELY